MVEDMDLTTDVTVWGRDAGGQGDVDSVLDGMMAREVEVIRAGAGLGVADAGGRMAILPAGMTAATATVPVTVVTTSVAATAAVTLALGTVVLMGEVSVRP